MWQEYEDCWLDEIGESCCFRLSVCLSVCEMVFEMTLCVLTHLHTSCLLQVEVTVNNSILIVPAWTFQDELFIYLFIYLGHHSFLHTKEELYCVIYAVV